MKLVAVLCSLTVLVSARVSGKQTGILDGVTFLEGVAAKLYNYTGQTPPAPTVNPHVKQAAAEMAQAIVAHSKQCFQSNADKTDEASYKRCTQDFCDKKCGLTNQGCRTVCASHASSLFVKLGGVPRPEAVPVSAGVSGKQTGVLDGVTFLEGVAAKIYNYTRPAPPVPAVNPRAKQAAAEMAQAIVAHSKQCFQGTADKTDESSYKICTQDFCDKKCGFKNLGCRTVCGSHASSLFVKLGGVPRPVTLAVTLLAQAHAAAGEEASAMQDLQDAQERMRRLNARIAKRILKEGGAGGKDKLARLAAINGFADQVDQHLATVAQFKQEAETKMG